MVMISGPKIYTETGILEDAVVVLENKKIKNVSLDKTILAKDSLVFPETYHLVPGFIDVHLHGANGADVMDGTVESLKTLSEALVHEGTTSYLATTMTADILNIERALKNVGNFIKNNSETKGATLLGVHLEGPFLSAKKTGAQSEKNILLPDKKYIQQWQAISHQAIKLVTIAPELAGSLEFIKFLRKENIVVSIGHTDATYAETMDAIHAGCSHMTHLFNAMRGIHQREPGPIVAGLLSEQVTTELILDSVHLHPAIVELAIKNKGKEKIILVTDAMRAKCLADGSYDLGGQVVTVKNNAARLADGTLAGSTLKMSEAIQNALKFTKCNLLDVIKFASENPAKMLNIFDRKGSIAPGKDADLVVLDEKLNVVCTIVGGRLCYSSLI